MTRSFLRTGLGAAAALFLSLAFPGSAIAADSTTLITDLTGKQTPLGQLTTPYLAIHILMPGSDPVISESIDTIRRSAPTLAGVTHLLIAPPGVQTAPATASPQVLVAADPIEAVRSLLGTPGDADPKHAMVVLDRSGKIIASITGGNAHSPTWSQISGAISSATKAPVKEYNLPKSGSPAVDGYDVTAYIQQSKPVKGSPKFASTYRGVTYHFATDQNRALFNATPDRYVPAYGGWCATAMANAGDKVEIDPTNFKVARGRLFLFYKGFLSDAKKDWDKKEAQLEPEADRFWRAATGENPAMPQ